MKRKIRKTTGVQTVAIKTIMVPIHKVSYGWEVRYGSLKGVGSYRTKAELIAALNECVEY